MKTLITVLIALLLSLWLTACSGPSQKYHQDFYIFGTVMGVTLWADNDKQAQQAFASLQDRFQGMHVDWHAWNPGMLTRINRGFSKGEAVEANEEIIEMIRRSQQLETATDGRFNPSIGALVGLWGFHTSEYPILGPPPAREDIDTLLETSPSSLDIRIDGLKLQSDNPAVQLDFGGIAKGYAVDLTIRRLRDLGISNAIVIAGGDLRAMGTHGDRPWRVAVRQPGGGSIGYLEVQGDEAIFTSGNYERFRLDQTERYPHILNPGTGWPAKDIASVTIITDEGLPADAAATALVVAGLEEWPAVARSLDLTLVAVVDKAGKVYMTENMEQRLQVSNDVEREIVKIR